jgi:ribonuclease E
VSDDDSIQDRPDDITAGDGPGEDLPDRLRVHTLARVLGTTSRRVLDALSQFDSRTRSAHSSVDRTDAVRVRDVLATAPPDTVEAGAQPEAGGVAVAEPESEVAVEEVAVEAEPESRLLLETPEHSGSGEVAERPADYLPLFVAPQPVAAWPFGTGDETDGDEDADESGDAEAGTDQSGRSGNRRRRRGRRGRGRGRGTDGVGEADGESPDSDDETTGGGDDSASGDDDGEENDAADDAAGDIASRRRRRRRRRKSGSADGTDVVSPDDPPNTVVHEWAPREKSGRSGKPATDSDEIQGISGSTRLEAKRQRRRDGRDASRRRPPILSEAEFLARREAVDRVMVVRDRVRTEPPHEGARYTQIAVLEDGVVVEHFVTSAASASLVGNVYLGIVQNVLPSMEAAFVDIGRGRNGVLYAGEVNWEAAGLGGANRRIEQALKPGDYVVVQVSKDPVGHKGARLTTQISLAGRYLVYVPGAASTGISRKLPDTERQRLKEILREVVPADAGVIIRTASEGVKEEDIRTDVVRLQERWNGIEAAAAETRKKAAGAAIALYEEPDVLVKVIRDLFNEDFSSLIVSGDNAWETINDYVDSVAPDLLSKLTKYTAADSPTVAGPDVFAVYRIDEQLAKAMDRKVWLPSGGTLVIDRTEAMTVVDVNTGKFTGSGGNLEQTVTKNNLEAAEEIVRQLRLRDIGGIIVVDFIDMVLESNRDLVLRRFTEALARDRTRHQVSEVTSLGLIQLTRKRLGTGLVEAFSTTCVQCAGRGILLHTDPVDSAVAPARKAEPVVSRRGRRTKLKSRAEDATTAVPKIHAHPAGEHPMFKAMAAANGRPTDADDSDVLADEIEQLPADSDYPVDEDSAIEDLALDAVPDSDEDDELDVDLDEDDPESDDDLEDFDLDDEADDADEGDDDEFITAADGVPDEESDAEDFGPDRSNEGDGDEDRRMPLAALFRPRRRAAARPAGPPRHDD